MSRHLSSAFDWLEDALAAVAGTIFVVLIFAIVYDVVGRRLAPGMSAPWTVEMSEYAMVYLPFLSAPWVLRQKAHVGVDFLVVRLSERGAARWSAGTTVVALAVCALLAWHAFGVVVDDWQRDVQLVKIWTVPRWVVRAAMPVGFTLLSIELSRTLFRILRTRDERVEVAP
jgi:TRAP-type C4-dicarboxylate transport system permease small subunit